MRVTCEPVPTGDGKLSRVGLSFNLSGYARKQQRRGRATKGVVGCVPVWSGRIGNRNRQ
jgi:hypothetical protein